MKKTIGIIVLALAFLLGGYAGLFAEDLPSCLNPENKEYHKPVIGGLCEKCGKTFTFSGDQLDHEKMGACPYCKHEQNLKEACNRYGIAHLSAKKK